MLAQAEKASLQQTLAALQTEMAAKNSQLAAMASLEAEVEQLRAQMRQVSVSGNGTSHAVASNGALSHTPKVGLRVR